MLEADAVAAGLQKAAANILEVSAEKPAVSKAAFEPAVCKASV